ncbi:MAG: hypothetical protein WCF85_06895 [Rhodospirillaceae bacterium]
MPPASILSRVESRFTGWRRHIALMLGLLGLGICYALPHLHEARDLVTHMVAAAIAVFALGLDMVSKGKRRQEL